MTSAVTRIPRFLPRRTESSDAAAERWATCTRPPVSSASRTSRSTIIASPADGAPRRPSSVATGPSFMHAPSCSVGSSQWSITTSSQPFAYSSARRIMRALATGLPSSETATQPASRRSPSSASCSPCCPRVIAPIGYTRTAPSARALSRIARVIPALSLTGSVLGIAHTAV